MGAHARVRTACAGCFTTAGPSGRSPLAPATAGASGSASGAGSLKATRSADVRISRELVRQIRAVTRRVGEIERELAALVLAKAPKLLEIHGCGVLTAASIIAETAGAGRFSSDAKLARTAGVAPIPASSGARHRHRHVAAATAR